MRLFGQAPAPELAAAAVRLGIAPLERAPLWAAHWLAEDHDGADLRLLAGMSGADLEEVRSVLPWALRQAGAPVPELGVAARRVCTALAWRHRQGLCGDGELLGEVELICRATGYAEEVLAVPLAQVLAVEGEWNSPGGRDRESLRPEIAAAVAAQLG